MTIREVINGWLELVNERQGRLSQDMEWSYRLIYYYLLLYRAKIIQEKRAKKQDISRWNIQTIPCITLIEVDKSDCPCAPPSGCIWLKSKYPAIRPIPGKYISVTSILGNKTYEYLRWDSVEDTLNSRFKAEREKAYYTLKDMGDKSNIYLISDNNKELVSATGIMEDPLEVIGYPNCGKENYICSPMDEQFVVDRAMLPTIYELMFDRLLKVKSLSQPELLNNEEPDTAKK